MYLYIQHSNSYLNYSKKIFPSLSFNTDRFTFLIPEFVKFIQHGLLY